MGRGRAGRKVEREEQKENVWEIEGRDGNKKGKNGRGRNEECMGRGRAGRKLER